MTQPQPTSQPKPAAPISTSEAAKLIGEAISEVQKVIVGQEHMVQQLMVGLLAKGHILLEGVPGTAKTLAVRTFSHVVGGSFARVQFTPDLVPSDIVGTRVYSAAKESFDTELGPVFVNFVLADEINRAPAKVQSAMLELMAEKQVSIAGVTYKLPKPFIVIATQNPVESEGVYPLPEAQRDRFLFKVDVPYPKGNEELDILRRMSVSTPEASQVLNPERTLALQDQASNIFVHNLVAEYIVRLVLATRNPADFGMADLSKVISIGNSSRATLGLTSAARALALIHGRDYVLPSDIQAVAPDVMGHRLVLSFDAIADNISSAQVVERILAMVPAPTPVWNKQQRQTSHQQHSYQPSRQEVTNQATNQYGSTPRVAQTGAPANPQPYIAPTRQPQPNQTNYPNQAPSPYPPAPQTGYSPNQPPAQQPNYPYPGMNPQPGQGGPQAR